MSRAAQENILLAGGNQPAAAAYHKEPLRALHWCKQQQS